MTAMKDVIKEILLMVGQDRLDTECGGDFPQCGADSNKDCPHFGDCCHQLGHVRKTKEIRKMLDEVT
jgi:hypothetical protein